MAVTTSPAGFYGMVFNYSEINPSVGGGLLEASAGKGFGTSDLQGRNLALIYDPVTPNFTLRYSLKPLQGRAPSQ